MNKISGILPTSSRIESVDMARERPVRAGSAGLGGQPVLRATQRPSTLGTDTPAGIPTPDQMANTLFDTRIKSESDMVKEMSDSFFMKAREPKSEVLEKSEENRLSIYA